jgi:hypothetical protein
LDPGQYRWGVATQITSCSLRATHKSRAKKPNFDTWIREVHLEAVHVIDLVLAKNDLSRNSIYLNVAAIKNGQSIDSTLSLIDVTDTTFAAMPRLRTCTS